jgi:uncharacterized protein YsxB (DUF464 family)
MITITVTTSKDLSFVSLIAKGHADSAPEGEDLVCAAVSAVVLGGFNALEENKNYEALAHKGYASLVAYKAPNEHDEVVLKTILIQLQSIAKSYPRNVALERKKQ